MLSPRFTWKLVELCGSPRAQDRQYARDLLHRIYSSILRRRSLIRKAIAFLCAEALETPQSRCAIQVGIATTLDLYSRCGGRPPTLPRLVRRR